MRDMPDAIEELVSDVTGTERLPDLGWNVCGIRRQHRTHDRQHPDLGGTPCCGRPRSGCTCRPLRSRSPGRGKALQRDCSPRRHLVVPSSGCELAGCCGGGGARGGRDAALRAGCHGTRRCCGLQCSRCVPSPLGYRKDSEHALSHSDRRERSPSRPYRALIVLGERRPKHHTEGDDPGYQGASTNRWRAEWETGSTRGARQSAVDGAGAQVIRHLGPRSSPGSRLTCSTPWQGPASTNEGATGWLLRRNGRDLGR